MFVWKKMNAIVHFGTPVHLVGLDEEIKTWGFIWTKTRGKKQAFIERLV